MNEFITKALRGRKVLLGKDFYQFRQVKRSTLEFGNRFASWVFSPDGLDENSVVYSFGVGEDVSFDLQLIADFRMDIHAFDPSPGSIAWVSNQDFPDGLHFYPFGLAAKDGQVHFMEPSEPGYHSLQIAETGIRSESRMDSHVLPVHRLPTILQKLGHKRVDILKMDIEGAEYEVIGDVVDSPVPISQLLIEFHHRFENIGIGKTRQAIDRLNKAGFRIFNVSASGEEISFINTSL
ncbi:MAG: FkbM family methyltransferase [Bacteroidota bacterium]